MCYQNVIETEVVSSSLRWVSILYTACLLLEKKCSNYGTRFPLPPFYRIGNWDTTKFTLLDALKAGVVLTEIGSYEPATQISGVRVIVDTSGLTMNHMKHMNPSILKKIVDYALVSGIRKMNVNYGGWLNMLSQQNL